VSSGQALSEIEEIGNDEDREDGHSGDDEGHHADLPAIGQDATLATPRWRE
jgi:hypothetical protein